MLQRIRTLLFQAGWKLALSILVISTPFVYVGVCYYRQLELPIDKAPWVYWSGLDPHKEVYVSWESADETDSFVRYGTDPEKFTVIARDDAPATLHRLKLTGLSPDTRYYYQAGPVPSSSDDALSAVQTFSTAPDTAREFTVTFVSDTQQIYGIGYYNTVAAAISRGPETAFVVDAGDLVQVADDQHLWNLFFHDSVFLDHIPIVPCPGNHDNIDHPEAKYIKYFGVTDNERDVYYAFDWGNARFIIAQIANISHIDPASPRNKAAYRWLEETLAASQDRAYRILVYHRDQHETIAPLVEKYNVSLSFHGHIHSYARYMINGHMYVCLGNGATVQDTMIKELPGLLKKTNGPGLTRLIINTSGIRLKSFTPGMDLMDEVFLRRENDTGLLTPEEIPDR